ncbi:ADP-ribosylglycohydrolase family protein [bacterium]|nr:ADP-ribosylglycohydrolase family protein [bacterium]
MGKRESDVGRGSIMGALAGDAAGAFLEFLGRTPTLKEVEGAMKMPGGGHFRLAPGQITDDGELTLCLIQALSESKSFEIERIACWYAKWVESNPFDVGNTTRLSIGCTRTEIGRKAAMEKGLAEAMSISARTFCLESKANGSLMRAAPIGVWGHRFSDSELAHYAKLDSCLSHPNPSCWQAVACYIIAIAELMNSNDRVRAFDRAKNWAMRKAEDEVIEWLSLAETNKKTPFQPQDGFVKIAFTHAFRHLFLGTSYSEAIRETLLGGGDTDTNACIVGGLIGAADGFEKIPAVMSDAVVNCDSSKGNHSRPDFLLPKNVFPFLNNLISPNS